MKFFFALLFFLVALPVHAAHPVHIHVAAPAAAPVADPPTASLAHQFSTSLQANPLISGTANNLVAPLQVYVTSSTTGQTVFAAEVASSSDWRVIVFPPIANGLYKVTVSSAGITLDRGVLVVGASLPAVLPDQSLGGYDVSDGHLLRFGMRGGATGTSVGQMTFTIAPVGAALTSVTLYQYADSTFGATTPTTTDSTLATAAVDTSSTVVHMVIDPPAYIPPGTIRYFALDGDVTPTDDTYSVTTSLVGDHGAAMAGTFDEIASANNFVWSPNSFGMASSSDSNWINSSNMPELFYGVTEERYATPVLSCDLESSADTTDGVTPITLMWSSRGADHAVWEDGSVTQVAGSKTFVAPFGRTYRLNFYGSLGVTQCAVTVQMDAPSAPDDVQLATVSTTTSQSVATTTATSSPVANFTATPTSGVVTLGVTFKGSVNNLKSCSASTYTLAYGDNSTSTIVVAARSCKAQAFNFSHSYTTVGTFTAKLYAGVFVKGKAAPPLVQSQQIIVKKKIAEVTQLFANVFSAVSSISNSLAHSVLGLIGF